MRSLRASLILSHILPLIIVVPLAGAALALTLESQVVLSELASRLSERANLIVEALEDQPDVWSDPEQAQTFLSSIADQVAGQVFLLNPGGALIAAKVPAQTDLPEQSPELEGLEDAQAGKRSVLVFYNLLDPGAEVLIPVLDARQELIGIVAVTQTLEGIFSQIGRMRTYIVLILVIELIVGTLIGYLLANRLARPISRAARGVTEIADGMDIEPVPASGPREIRRLSGAVNTLADRLRVLEESRRRSLANIVHELGRPLGAIRAAVHVLLKRPDDPEIEHELLVGIDGEVKQMQPLLDDLTLLHGQVTRVVTLELQRVSLSGWLLPVLLPWRAAVLEKGIEFQAQVPENLPEVSLDPDRMTRVVGNLLSNALKYTPKGGVVRVTAGATGGEAWIRVSDNGPGIIEQEQERVFEPFYRSQRIRRFPQGLGLGLTIARDIVEAHGGCLELVSAPGKGSDFTIHLPLK